MLPAAAHRIGGSHAQRDLLYLTRSKPRGGCVALRSTTA
jgi:hypothetical protein